MAFSLSSGLPRVGGWRPFRGGQGRDGEVGVTSVPCPALFGLLFAPLALFA